ncbi:ABC transporter ATP-binding protein [Paraburkholderia acidiphila]|uniref:ATP-binding cassette domain-containing protein n=1 Tax=Paraburkholderia acidiphila TaxID=2571747 RepID=A0A7Z2G9K2_9BURK|nr:ABC transporter ATP-binding protein [Paraburkholderia acidiphila]QGZ57703.1 ATP-binding cassette domain-containing protein [Paraburkholderia acidiphila]
MATDNSMLEVRDLHAYYGKSHILHGVEMRVGEGEIVALLGRNGVGRSTLAKAIMGLVRCEGQILLRGEEVRGLRTFEVAHRGIGYVPENRDIFPTLTVRQNLMLGEKRKRSGQRRRQQPRWQFDDMYRMFPRLKEREETPAGLLSGGEQQMLTLCRTLMGDPDLIIIDEPTEGLAPLVVAQVGEYLKALKARGISVLLVEQKQAIALDISQRVYVMGHGQIVFEGTPQQLKADAGVRQEWLEV